MAKIGLLKPRYCKITETETDGVITETLGTGKVFAKAIKASISVQTSSSKLYADDGVAESMKDFVGGTLSFEADDIEDTVKSDIHGATLDTEDGDIIFGTNDVAPFLRFGFLVREVRNGVPGFRGIVYLKTQFTLPSEEYETKGENLVYKSTTETADIMRNKDFQWKREKHFADMAAADTYVNELLNIVVTP
jgi:phi13 family phage major tail protein